MSPRNCELAAKAWILAAERAHQGLYSNATADAAKVLTEMACEDLAHDLEGDILVCAHCGGLFRHYTKPGRVPRYCATRCSQAAYRVRKLRQEGT